MTQANTFYDVTYGSIRLWCESVSTDNSRTQVVHELAEGDEHPVQDRGRKPGRPVTCELLWIEMPSEADPPQERFLRFKALADAGPEAGPQLFVHPVDGAYYANVENFNYTIDEDENISQCSVTFIHAADISQPLAAGAGASIRSGEQSVEDAATSLDDTLIEVGIDSDVPSNAIAAASSWADSEAVPTRQVIVDVAELSTQLASLIEDEGLEDDLALWDAYKQTIELGAAVRAAALAALAETPKLTGIYVADSISLLALCVRLYGGGEAEDRARQIAELNDIRTPAWVASGSVVMIPVPSAARRLALAA